ncbi:MAG: type IV secretion system protein [Rickettsiales bacterium]|jgi:type IV secretory pathway VirB6-like protein|nr:type IV secretion system protein [Rickettsiales bacterium]
MIKKNILSSLKQYVSMLMAIVIFSFCTTSNVLALHDIAREQLYTVKTVNSSKVFNSTMGELNPYPYFGIGDPSTSGDMSIEITNPFCLAYIAVFLIAMYAGNLAVKIVAVVALIALVAVIYGVTKQKLKDFEICGADWLVWGYKDSDAEGDYENIRKYYPEKGAFKGSKKWIAEECVKNTNECMQVCESGRSQCEGEACITYPDKNENCYLDTNFIKERSGKQEGQYYLGMEDRLFREFFYDGEEIATPNCIDPREEVKGYDIYNTKDGVTKAEDRKQVYYFRGTEPANYACDRFLLEKKTEDDEFDKAYKCCINESSKLCIFDKDNSDGGSGLSGFIGDITTFASGSSKYGNFCETSTSSIKMCTISSYIIKVERGMDDDNKFCASTWSLCPYNLNLQKGTEKSLGFDLQESYSTSGEYTVIDECYDTEKKETLFCKGRAKNFYQLNRHCAYINEFSDQKNEITRYSPYIDKACINMVGSSHNTEGYKSYDGYQPAPNIYAGSFSAPLVECITETMKNLLFNRAGHTECLGDELPGPNETCLSSTKYVKNENFNSNNKYASPTTNLLKAIGGLIRIALVIMMMLYGWSILINAGKIETKDVLVMLVKMMFVLGFSANTTWYTYVYNLTYSLMDTFSSLTTKITFDMTTSITGQLVHDDGCYFGNSNEFMGTENENKVEKIADNNYYKYPNAKKYVMFFDTLDCKVQKYLGMSNLGSTSKILQMVAMSFLWPFNAGLYLMVASAIFMFFTISLLIKSALLFMKNALALGIFLYIAPLCIPGILFKKTTIFFNQWLTFVISNCLQPMLYFAYISMAIGIIDQYVLGNAMYVGHGKSKQLVCGYACIAKETSSVLDENGGYIKNNIVINYIQGRNNKKLINESQEACLQNEGTTDFIDLKDNSVLCFIESFNWGPVSIMQPFGIFISMVKENFVGNFIMLLRVAFLLLILDAGLGMVSKFTDGIIGNKGQTPASLDKKVGTFHLAAEALDTGKMAKRFASGAGKKMLDKFKTRKAALDNPDEEASEKRGETDTSKNDGDNK